VEEPEDQQEGGLPATVQAFIQRLFRDPRYLLIDRFERYGRERISFIEACTILSATGEVQGQALLNKEFERRGRPDGERPYDQESLLDHCLQTHRGEPVSLTEEEVAALQEESWQYYVRRNFDFLLEDYFQARDDAEHNLGIWNLIDRCDASASLRWGYLKWWPWIERDRAMAQALWDLQRGEPDHAATELYRAQRSIEQFGERHAEEYEQEEGDNRSLCGHMGQHAGALVELLRREQRLPISLEEQFDAASARGDEAEMNRVREEMIRRAVDAGE